MHEFGKHLLVSHIHGLDVYVYARASQSDILLPTASDMADAEAISETRSQSAAVEEIARTPDQQSSPSIHASHHESGTRREAQATPLPKLQLFILLYLQLAEPIASSVVYPFVNQLVRETGVTGGDDRKTGYFAGLIVSA